MSIGNLPARLSDEAVHDLAVNLALKMDGLRADDAARVLDEARGYVFAASLVATSLIPPRTPVRQTAPESGRADAE